MPCLRNFGISSVFFFLGNDSRAALVCWRLPTTKRSWHPADRPDLWLLFCTLLLSLWLQAICRTQTASLFPHQGSTPKGAQLRTQLRVAYQGGWGDRNSKGKRITERKNQALIQKHTKEGTFNAEGMFCLSYVVSRSLTHPLTAFSLFLSSSPCFGFCCRKNGRPQSYTVFRPPQWGTFWTMFRFLGEPLAILTHTNHPLSYESECSLLCIKSIL